VGYFHLPSIQPVIKAINILTGINAVALLVFIGWYFISASGRNVDTMEKGWTAILFIAGLVVVLLGIVPSRISQTTFSLYFSLFFAALPSLIVLCVVVSKQLPSFTKQQTMAEFYYKDKVQRSIAAAIEQSDTTQLRTLIEGKDLSVQGNRVWGGDGLNYLQFAVRLRSNPGSFPFSEKANTAAIRLLIGKGSPVTPALAEAARYLPPETFRLLLDAGADPNTQGFTSPDPLLFETIGPDSQQNAIAIMLLQHGADKNAKAANNREMTPVMFAANNAQTSPHWNRVWRLVYYLLEEAKCDYTYTTWDGFNLQTIIRTIRQDAADQHITMPPDFIPVVNWLEQHDIDTEPPAL
jgi:hypothetical protein